MEVSRTKTRSGTDVIITHEFQIGRKPIHGAWWDFKREEWIPASWTTHGRYFDNETQTALDLDLLDFVKNK